MRFIPFLLLASIASPALAQSAPERGDLGWMVIRDSNYEADLWRWQYPVWAYTRIKDTEVEREFDLRGASNPFLLNGDFDGDGQYDVAAWVERREARKGVPPEIGVIIVHHAGGTYYIATGGPNWELYPKGVVEQGVGEGSPPILRGDALLFEKPESSSWLWYWDGSSYRKYQQGD